MTNSTERAEAAVSFLARTGVSLALPAWGLAMLLAGVARGSPWWAACGVVVGAIGIVMAVGNPLLWALVDEIEARPPRP